MSEYNDFIDEILKSRENRKFKNSERHHILPRCIGGTNDKFNMIYLTPDEHFTAHKLLAKEYPDNDKLVYALIRMCDGHRIVTEEEYESIRIKAAECSSKRFKGTGNPFYGKHHSEEARNKMSAVAKKRTKEKNSFYGKKHSEEARKKMSESHKKQVWVKTKDETSAKMIDASELSSYLENGWVRGRLSSSFTGAKNPFYGKHHSEETRKKLSKPIIQLTLDGKFLREFESIRAAAREMNMHEQNINACCKGKLHTSGGFIWRYK